MSHFYNSKGPEKAAKISINGALLQQAKALEINLSATLEHELAHLIRLKRCAQWLEENRAALDDYNAFVGKHSVLSDRLRRFLWPNLMFA
jgi:antitoxin CcdA